MKKIFILIIFISLALTSPLELPKINSNDEIISHSYFTLSYNENHEQANWVAYKLTRNMIENGSYSRTNNYRPDYKVKNSSSQLSDYKYSDYDKGHLCPASDMKISKTGMSESFFMSNISPQNPSFNKGIWKTLEGTVRTWAINNEEIYIVTGPILTNVMGSIGSNSVSVPKYFYKVILAYNQPEIKGIGFIIENKKGELSLTSYAVSIDDVEKITGIDFFPLLPDEIENHVESFFSIDKWSWEKTNSKKSTESNSVSCNGKTTKGKICRNKTLNSSGYCYLHEGQSDPSFNPKSERLSSSNRCTSNTKKGSRCKRKTYCLNYKCSSHGGNCY